MGRSNNTVYSNGGEFGGLGVHNWHCLGCQWTHTTVGGRREQSSGQSKAESHNCYNSSKDSWKQRKDLE